MNDREIDAAIAEKVMGWNLYPQPGIMVQGAPSPGGEWGWKNDKDVTIWHREFQPATDRNASALVLERIGELSLREPFSERALFVVGALHLSGSRTAWWRLINITPRQICEAALACVQEKV